MRRKMRKEDSPKKKKKNRTEAVDRLAALRHMTD